MAILQQQGPPKKKMLIRIIAQIITKLGYQQKQLGMIPLRKVT
jgi:hypothetical protein